MNNKFTRFKLDNVWSAGPDNEDFNAFIVHDGVLELFNTPSFSNEIVYPKLGDNSHFLGVEIKELELSYSILVKEVTLEGYRKFLDWINFREVKKLYLDYNDEGQYRTVKVSSISKGEVYPVNVCENGEITQELYNVFLDVTFVTVGDWALLSEKYEVRKLSCIKNEGSLPMFFEVLVKTGNFTLWGEEVEEVEEAEEGALIDNISWDEKNLIMNRAGGSSDFFLFDSRTGILYKATNDRNDKKEFFEGKVNQSVFRFLLDPGKSMVFKSTSDMVYVYAIRRDYV